MSTNDTHGHDAKRLPVHDTVTFEPRDIDIGTIARYLVYLAITIIVALAICIPILKVLTHISEENDTPMAPVRARLNPQQLQQMSRPPEPRLQGVPGHESDPQADMRGKVQADNEANEKYGWVDKSKGIVQIPVSEAMKIIAEKGAVPSSTAAERPAQEKKP